jgi:predicted GTPase
MGNGGGMAVDFEALDLVRSENKSRSYNRKLDDLQRKNSGLRELVQEMVQEVPEHRRKYFLEKIKNSS